MKKVIMMLLGVAFATCAMAADNTYWHFYTGTTKLKAGYTGKGSNSDLMPNATVYCLIANGANGIGRTMAQNDLLSDLRDYGVIAIEDKSAVAATGTTDENGKIPNNSVSRVDFQLNDWYGISIGDTVDFYEVAFSPEGDFVYISGLVSATAEDPSSTFTLSSAASTTLVDKDGTKDFSDAGWYSLASTQDSNETTVTIESEVTVYNEDWEFVEGSVSGEVGDEIKVMVEGAADEYEVTNAEISDGEEGMAIITITIAEDLTVTIAKKKPLAPIEYLTWDEGAKTLVAATNTTYEVVTADTEKFEDGKWYVVTNTIERAGITVNGEAHLILCDDASLTVTGEYGVAGVEVAEGKALTIYGQSEGTGTLVAKGGDCSAGIGGGCDNGGTVTINGGTITTTGGLMAAGIGGAVERKGGMVTINGGTITATGSYNSAGIGGAVTPDGKADDGTVSFGEGVEFSIKAGASEVAATATTVADYVADHSAAYVKIEVAQDLDPIKVVGGSQSKVGDEDIYIFDPSKVGTMVLREVVEAHILVVGGGGAGASPAAITYQRGGAGGGGAGGFIENKSQIFMPGTYTITVGKGGAKGEDATASEGANGEPSSIVGGSINISAAGGGGGGLGYDTSHGLGHDGGSGGGGSAYSASAQKDGGSPVAEQGKAGGKGTITRAGAGGGGAGSAGADSKREGMNDIGGAGGAGVESDITGEAKSYAAGGGGGTHANYSSYVGVGGTGGSEIGGNGGGGSRTGGQTAATSGEAGTGSGGGGGCNNLAGGAGGSGVVIIRIKKIIPLVIEAPAEGEFFGFVNPGGFALPILLGASDDDLKNPAGFAVKVTSCGSTLYEKEDVLFRKGIPTEVEITEGYSYDETNVIRTATITVKTPDGRVTTRTLTFGVIPKGGVIVHDLDEINAAIGKAEEEKKYPLVLVKANVIALETGDSIALPTPDTNVNVYFSSVNRDEELFDISAIVPTFGSPYDVVTNFADSNLVYLDPELEWSTSAKDWVVVGYTTNVLTTVEQQLAHFINTNDVAKLVYDAERKTISLIGRGESEDFPWILDASTNVTAWVENSSLVINNGLNSEAYDIDLVAMTNNFAKYSYTAPANALVKVVNGSTTNTVTSAGWVGANGAYATLEDAIAAGEAKVLPGYAVSYEANGAAGVMTNSIFAVNKQVTLKSNAFSAVGYDFDGWTAGTNTYQNAQSGTNFASVDGTLALTAQWSLNTNGVTETSFTSLTNTITKAGQQGSTLPITIDFTSDVVIPADAVISAFPSGTGFSGIKYVGDEEGGSNLELKDGVLYGSAMRGEVTVDALVLMQLANGGSISSFQAVSEGETTVTNAVVMLLGDDGKAYFNDTDDVDEMIADILAADPRPTKVKLYEAKSYCVSYDGAGAVGTMATDMFIPTVPTNLTANVFSALGYTFAGWTTNGVDEVAYANGAAGVDFTTPGETLELTAKWNATGVSIDAFDVLTNTLVAVTNQAASLPVTITLTGEIAVPQDGVITVNASPAITFAGEAMLDVSAIVPTFGTPTVVGEGFTSTNAPALFDTKGVSKLVYEDGTISLIGRGESEDFPWILDATTNVTAWVESSNLVIDTGLTAESYEIDLVALTNNVATYSYTPASPLNAVVKVGEADYKTPTCWTGESDSYETLGAALEAGETTVLPGYEVVYEANGAAGSMTNSYFAAAKEATLKANAFSAVGYDFDGWTLGTNTTVIADSATVKDLASVDGSATLTAQWKLDEEGVTVESYEALTNTIATAGLQKTNLPITIDFTSDVKIPEGATLPTLPTNTGFSGIRYVPEEESYSTLSVSNGVLYASMVRREVTVDALVLMQHAMGGSIAAGKLQAYTTDEAGETITTNIVMFVGDNHKAYFNDTDDVDEMITDILAADPRPTTVKLFEVKGAMVTFEAMGGTIGSGTDPLGNDYDGGVERITYLCMPDSGYELPVEVTREGYTLKGWFDGWTTSDNEITNNQEIVDYSEHSLYAQWTSTAPVQSEEGELHFADIVDDEPVKEIAAKEYAKNTELKVVTTPLYLEMIGQRAFTGCESIEKLTLTATRDYGTLELTTLKLEPMAFAGCKSLKELTIGGDVEIGVSAFQNCTKLEKIIFRGVNALTCDASAFVFAGTDNGKGEIKLYMTQEFRANNTELVNNLMTYNNGIVKVDVVPVEDIGLITISDGSVIVPGEPLAFFVKTIAAGTPDVDSVDIQYSTDMTNWSALKDGTAKIAYPDGTIMIEVTVPEGSSGYFKAVLNTQQD